MEPGFYFESCEQKPDSSAAVCSAARRDNREAVCHSDDSHVPADALHSATSRLITELGDGSGHTAVFYSPL